MPQRRTRQHVSCSCDLPLVSRTFCGPRIVRRSALARGKAPFCPLRSGSVVEAATGLDIEHVSHGLRIAGEHEPEDLPLIFDDTEVSVQRAALCLLAGDHALDGR